jgi:YVTN family beta-propeller protein
LTRPHMASDRFDFRILGPIEARLDGEPVSLGGPKQRALLAILLLSANRVVSRERLIDDLLDAPVDADRALRVQVSRLRKALDRGGEADSRLITRAPGYLLVVDEGELDLHRFEALVHAGRQAIESGESEAAVRALRNAESLWQGGALEGLESEPFAPGEIVRLDELRLAATEGRIEAELALGRHALVVPELDTLVTRHPLRERLRAQLMLALYRCGRQADALEEYRQARSVLSDQLGLEPGPQLRDLERAILRQDEALELPSTGWSSTAAHTPGATASGAGANRAAGHHRRRDAAVVAVLAATLVAVFGVVLLANGGGSEQQLIEGNALAMLSTISGRPIASTPLDAAPTRIASGAGSVWVSHVDTGTISRVDPVSRTVRQTIRVGDGPFGVAVSAGDVWVANSLDGTVSRVDPATSTVVQTIAVGAQPSAVATSGRTVWVANRGDDTLVRLDAVTGRVTGVIDTGSEPSDLAVSGDTVWVSNQGDGTVSRIDAPSGAAVQTIRVGDGPSGLVASSGGVWVINSLDATVSRIEPLRGVVAATIPVGGRPAGISASGGLIWVSDSDSGRLLRIDSRDGVAVRKVVVGERAGPLAHTEAGQWIGVASGGSHHRGGTLTIASPFRDVRSLDPAVLDDITPLALLGLTNDGLVTLNHVGGPEGAQLVPDLALSLPSPSEDGRTYTFRLRRGIRYSTGQAVKPRDIRRSFERLFELGSSGRSLYDRIDGAAQCLRGPQCNLRRGIVTNDGDYSVTFHLVTPDPEFLYKLTLTYGFVLPANTPSRVFRSPLPATGPYMIRQYKPGREIRLVRNPRFRVWSSAAQPAGYPDTIVWRLGLSPGMAARLVERGEADLMSDIGGPPAEHVDELRIRFAGQVHSNPTMITDFFFLNTKEKPFDDIRVRRALNYAINRNRVVAIYGGPSMAQPTCQILPPQMPGFRRYCPYTRDVRSSGRWRAPDLQKARQFVAASGTKGMVVNVWSTPRPTVSREQGRYVTAVLRRLGYRAELHLLPDAAFFRYTDDSRNKAQVVSGGWGADYPSASAFIGKVTCRAFIPNSESTFNTGQFCDPEIDRQVARAERLQTTNRPRALEAWRRLDKQLTDLAIWLPTVTSTLTDIVSKRVENYQFHPFWGVLVDQLWVS